MKTRIFHTKFWTDTYIRRLKSDEKLLFVYLITNEFVNIIDLYELPLDIASQHTSLTEDQIKEILAKFQADEKIICFREYIYMVNSFKYQYYKGPKNNYLKLRLIFELNDAVLEHFKKQVSFIVSSIQREALASNTPDEKIMNLLDRLTDRGIYPSDTPIHTSVNIINQKEEIEKEEINNDADEEIVDNDVEKGKTSLSFQEMKAQIGKSMGGISTQWQDDAFGHADYLGINLKDNPNLKGRWLGFYKRSFSNKALYGRIQQALSFLKDYTPFQGIPSAEGRMRYYFDVVQNYEKYNKGGGEKNA